MTKIRNLKQLDHRVLVIEYCDLGIICNLVLVIWDLKTRFLNYSDYYSLFFDCWTSHRSIASATPPLLFDATDGNRALRSAGAFSTT